jgi:prepilin-type N-terminal cleavage/methylation domain-containing protein
MLLKRITPLWRQAGFTLLETLIALGILAVIGVAFLTTLNTAYKNVELLEEQTQAEALIRSQLDDIKASPYQDSGIYPVTVTPPPQYSVNITVVTLDTPTCVQDGNCNTLQEVTVSVYRTGDGGERPILSVKTYKAKT